MIRKTYVHDAGVVIEPGGDPAALGGAVTVALCGHWDHPPPCPLAPHHTTTTRAGDRITLRVRFDTEPENEQRVRSLIRDALAAGRLTGPGGRVTSWALQPD